VAGVEQAAEFFGLGQPGVHLVEEKGGLVLMNEAEEDRGGEVFGAERPRRQSGDDVEDGGFAEAWLGEQRLRRGSG